MLEKHHFTSLSDNNGNNNMKNPVLSQNGELRACSACSGDVPRSSFAENSNPMLGGSLILKISLKLKPVIPRTGLVSSAPNFTRKLTIDNLNWDHIRDIPFCPISSSRNASVLMVIWKCMEHSVIVEAR
jgi:hypothetical protein